MRTWISITASVLCVRPKSTIRRPMTAEDKIRVPYPPKRPKKRFEESKNVIGGIAYPAHKYGKVIYETA